MLCYNFHRSSVRRTDQKEGFNEEWKLLCVGWTRFLTGSFQSRREKSALFFLGKGERMARKESFVKTIQPLCEKLASDMGLSFYDISLDREPAGLYLRIYIDAEGGLSLDQCEAFHRAVQPKVERYEYDFLEVCSPGIDRPVKTDRDAERAMGTTVSVHLFKALDGRKDFEGTLLKMDKETVTIAENGQEISFPRAQVSLVRMVPDLSALDEDAGDAVEILETGLTEDN